MCGAGDSIVNMRGRSLMELIPLKIKDQKNHCTYDRYSEKMDDMGDPVLVNVVRGGLWRN